jgi:hypothetical protein
MTLERPMFPPPAGSAGELTARLATQQRERQTSLYALARLRKEARAEIDRLIQFLDQSDLYVMTELENDDEREPEPDEPSLGSLDRTLDQVRWAMGSCDDTEHEHDGREPEDREDDPADRRLEGDQ